MLRNCTNVFF